MARNAAIKKLGFYPTPSTLFPKLAKMITVKNWHSGTQYRHVVVDPCAGAGDALVQLRTHVFKEVCTVLAGIELDAERYQSLRLVADTCVQGDGLAYCSVINGSTSGQSGYRPIDFLWLNPPYDTVFTDEGVKDRYELSFLSHWIPQVKASGIFVYVVRRPFLKRYYAEVMAVLKTNGCHGVSVIDFPEPEIAEFEQVMVVGYGGERKTKYSAFAMTEHGDLDYLPRSFTRYTSHPTWFGLEEPSTLSVDFAEIPESGVDEFGETEELDLFFGNPSQQAPFRPLAQVRQEHAILLAASGFLNGVKISDQFVLRGYNKRIVLTSSETLDDGTIENYETERFVHTISLLDLRTGDIVIYDDYANPDDYEKLMLEIGERLLETVQALYQPVFTPADTAQYEPYFRDIISSKRLPNMDDHDGSLLPVQKQTAAAIVTGFKNNRVITLGGEMSIGKTGISLAAMWVLMKRTTPENRRLVVLCPANRSAVNKWVSEAEDLLGKRGVSVFLCRDQRTVDQAFACTGPSILILPETSAKLTSGWTNIVTNLPKMYQSRYFTVSLDDKAHIRKVHQAGQFKNVEVTPAKNPVFYSMSGKKLYFQTNPLRAFTEDGKGHYDSVYTPCRVFMGYRCPSCGSPVGQDQIADKHLRNTAKMVCPSCQAPLWRAVARKEDRLKVVDHSAGFKVMEDRSRGLQGKPVKPGPGGKVALAKYLRNQYKNKFYLIIDECFPGHTLVETEQGPKRIDQIQVGMRVLSHKDGQLVYRDVLRVLKQPLLKSTVRVAHQHGEFVCTEDHKIFTQRGKVKAVDLRPGDTLFYVNTETGLGPDTGKMLAVRQVLHGAQGSEVLRPELFFPQSGGRIQKEAGMDLSRQDLSYLREGLSCEGENSGLLQFPVCSEIWPVSRDMEAKTRFGRGETGPFCADADQQPYDETWSVGQDESGPDRSQAITAQREWHRVDQTAGSVVAGPGQGLGLRVPDSYGELALARCGSGPGVSPAQAGCRGRWVVSQHETAAQPGPAEGKAYSGCRVAFGESEQSSGGSGLARLCVTDSTVVAVTPVDLEDDYVYDLTVDDTHRYFANGALVSNCHDYKAADSARGFITMDLLESCRKALQMTGTLSNGKASSIFYMLYRSNPAFRKQYEYTGVQAFVTMFGLHEKVTRMVPVVTGTSVSGYNEFTGTPQEIPGTHPGMVSLMLENSVFVNLADLAYAMPSYTEFTAFVPMTDELTTSYQKFISEGASVAQTARKSKDMSVFSRFIHARYRVLDRPFHPDEIGFAGQVARFSPPNVPEDTLLPKEEFLIRLILEQKSRNRKVLCFITQINAGDPTPRLLHLLTLYGLRGTVMRMDVQDRVEFIDAAVGNGVDVIFTSPRLVTVSVDLINTPTIVWYGVEYMTTVYEQTNRRPWRLIQKNPVEIYYLAYQRTVQADAFNYIAKKMLASVTLQGRRIGGLAGLHGGDTFARKLQSIVDTSEVYDSDLTLESLPVLPSEQVTISLAEVTYYLPTWMSKRWGNRPNVARWGVCRGCMLDFTSEDEITYVQNSQGVFRYHAACCQKLKKVAVREA